MKLLFALVVMILFSYGSAQTTLLLGTRCNPCEKIDIVFSLENSANLSPADYNNSIAFVQSFVNKYQVNLGTGGLFGGNIRIGAVSWSAGGFSQTISPLTSNYTALTQSLSTAFLSNNPYTFPSNVTFGLLYAQSLFLNSPSPSNTPRLVVLIAYAHNYDGASLITGGESEASRLLYQQGTYVLVISVGALSNTSTSWAQFSYLSGLYDYNFTEWAEPSFSALASDQVELNDLFNYTCGLDDPLPQLFRPACPLMQQGYYGDRLKDYPPGSYALGTIMPFNYTTWGSLVFNPPPYFPPLSFTVSFWVFLNSDPPPSTKTNWTFISQSIDGSYENTVPFHIGLVNGLVHVVVGNGGTSGPYLVLDAYNPLVAQTWYLISVNVEQLYRNASVYSDQTDIKYASLYINGNPEDIELFSYPTANSTIPIQVGRSALGGNLSRCDCFFDEIQIWNTCQTGALQASHAEHVASGREPNLVGYWDFEDSTEANFNDLSPSGNTAYTLGSTPWLVQVAELDPTYCAPANIPTIREFDTVCNDPPGS